MCVSVQLDGRVGRLTLDRADAMNAITVELASALERGLTDVADAVDAIVIRGAGGNFCVGGDFGEVERLRAQGPDALAELFAAFGRACALIGRLDVPVVAAVDGYAMAGGFELMQACDIAVVREDAVLSDNHANFGMVPGGGGSQRLPRLVGRARAGAHMLLGDRISGADAAAWGLAYRAAPAAGFDAAVDEVLARLLAKTRTAQATTKRLIRDGLELPLADGLAMEAAAVVAHLGGEDAASGIDAFHAREKR